MGEDCILFLMFCLSRARLSCLLFFPGCQTKREERWRGRHPGGREEGGWWGGGEMEGLLTCTCLQSLRIHCTIHLLCLYCHGWGQSDQTPIRYLILPPHAPPPVPPLSPNTFFHVTCWLKEKQRQFTSIPKWGECQEGNPHQNQVVMEIQYGPEFTE